MTKHRLYRTQSLTVDMPALWAVDLALHPFDDTRFLFLCDVQGDIDLSGCVLGGISETTLSQPATVAVFFVALKLHKQVRGQAAESES